MARPRFRCFVVLLAALGAAGCDPISWTRLTLNQPIKAEDVAFIVPGQTKLEDVIARLGAPDQLIGARDGIVVNYLYEDEKYFRVNFGWPLGFVSGVSHVPHDFVLANSALGADTFQVAFDTRGTVRYSGFFHGTAGTHFKMSPFDSSKP